jgi:rhodanese-related sulfurtransferase
VSLSPDTCVRQTENIFERWGFYSLVVSKFIPGFSTVAPPVAGALRMPLGQFLLATLASASLWVGAALGVGLAFSDQIESILRLVATHGGVAAAVLGVLLAAWVGWKAFKRWRIARVAEGARIEVHELARELASPAPPLVVDVGTRLGHESRPRIPGALLLDLDTIAGDYAFPRDRPIVFYCACPNEASAKRAVQLLAAKGFSNVRPLIGGIDGWVAAGQPTESPASPPPSVRTAEPAA